MPENESDPPQFRPSTIFEAGVSTRFSAAACSIEPASRRLASSTVALVPPHDCSVIPTRRPRPAASRSGSDRPGSPRSPGRSGGRRTRWGDPARRRSSAQQFSVASDDPAAPVAVREGHHAVHVERHGSSNRRATSSTVSRAVARGNYGDVVPGAHAAVRPRVAEEHRTARGRALASPGRELVTR